MEHNRRISDHIEKFVKQFDEFPEDATIHGDEADEEPDDTEGTDS